MKIGMSSCAFALDEAAFSALAETGIDCIEISLHYLKHSALDFAQTARLSKTYGVSLWSYHLPFAPPDVLDIASTDEGIRRHTVEYWSELIKKGAAIGVRTFVVHPSSEPKSEGEARAREMDAAMTSLASLAECASRAGGVIAVEDLPRSCLGRSSEEIACLISADDRLRVCFDTNHLLVDDNLNFIEKLGDKIATLHVSDYDFLDEKHWLPGEGRVDFPALYEALLRVGYTGPWMYEVGLTTPKTVTRPRPLTLADFKKNAETVFSGKSPTPFGTPTGAAFL